MVSVPSHHIACIHSTSSTCRLKQATDGKVIVVEDALEDDDDAEEAEDAMP